MARVYTYPHNDNQVRDDSYLPRVSRLQECLHQTLWFIQAATGRANEPLYVSGAEAVQEYGNATFDKASAYYGNEQFYLEEAIFPYHGATLVRLVDAAAKKSSLVLELHITEAEVTQYKRDANGAIILDENGERIPLLDSGNQIIKEPGLKFKYVTRVLADDEKYDQLRPRTVEVGNIQTQIFPVRAELSRSPGSYTDNTGYKMYFDYYSQDSDILENQQALTYVFEPQEITYGTSIVSPIRDKFGAVSMSFTAKPKVYDDRLRMYISHDEKMKNNFYETQEDGEDIPMLPYDVHLYSESFEAIGTLVQAVETNDTRLTSPWMVDALSARNLDGYQYHHVEIDYGLDTAMLSETYVHFLTGGTDGDTSRAAHEERIRAWLTGNVYPFIVDELRYPLTHMYDVGYSIDTKESMLAFMAVRRDVKPIMSSQDISMDANTREEDYSMAYALRAKALLVPESMIYGTQCCRAEIYCCVGRSTNNQYLTPIPLTLWACARRAESMASERMKFTLGGQPYSVIDMVKNLSYVEYDKDMKQMKFNNGINYPQYADRITIFFPDVRTVYPKTTSLLAGASFTDAVTILKNISNKTWALYTGSDKYPEELYRKIGENIARNAHKAYGSHYGTSVEVDQTEDMRINGDELRVQAEITGNLPFRKQNTVILPKRYNSNGYSYSTSSTSSSN